MCADTPLVSIITPTRHMAGYLPTALHSVAGQDHPAIEHLVYDAGEDTETPALVERLGVRGRYVRERDAGQSEALNKGFAAASGEILAWMNADDYYFPTAVSQAVAAFAADPELDVLYGDVVFVDRDSQFYRYFTEVEPHDAHRLYNYADYICQPGAFFRRRALETVGLLDTALHYTMDWDLWCRMARARCKFRYVPSLIAASRLYPQTKTASGGAARLRELWQINQRYRTTTLPLGFINYSRWEVPPMLLGALMSRQAAARVLERASAARRALLGRRSVRPLYGIHHDHWCDCEAQIRLPLPVGVPEWLEVDLVLPPGADARVVRVSIDDQPRGEMVLGSQPVKARFELTPGRDELSVSLSSSGPTRGRPGAYLLRSARLGAADPSSASATLAGCSG